MADERPYTTDPEMQTDAMPSGSAEVPTQAARERRADAPVRTEVVDNRSSGEMNDWTMPDMDQFRQRFDELQAEFIQEPRSAVQKAETLVDEAIKRMMTTFQERLRRIQGETGETSDTEMLRVTMMRYREFMDSLTDRRAA